MKMSEGNMKWIKDKEKNGERQGQKRRLRKCKA